MGWWGGNARVLPFLCTNRVLVWPSTSCFSTASISRDVATEKSISTFQRCVIVARLLFGSKNPGKILIVFEGLFEKLSLFSNQSVALIIMTSLTLGDIVTYVVNNVHIKVLGWLAHDFAEGLPRKERHCLLVRHGRYGYMKSINVEYKRGL